MPNNSDDLTALSAPSLSIVAPLENSAHPAIMRLVTPIGSPLDLSDDVRSRPRRPREETVNNITVMARWVTAMLEPLVSTALRVEAEERVMELTRLRPAWMSTWATGVLHQIVHAYPVEDPWRHLIATVDFDILAFGEETPDLPNRLTSASLGDNAPTETGACFADGSKFGLGEAGLDLTGMQASGVDLTDIATAALSPNLSPVAAAILGFAASEKPSVMRDALGRTYQALWKAHTRGLIHRAPEDIFVEAITQALRWAVFRYRCYSSPSETYIRFVTFEWFTRTDRVVVDRQSIYDLLDLVEHGKIPDGDYDLMTGGRPDAGAGFSFHRDLPTSIDDLHR